MDAFVTLFVALDATTKTNAKQALLADWFRSAAPADAAWGLFFLSGRKLPQPLPARRLRSLAGRLADLPPWLFEECYAVVGDLAETVALLLPAELPAPAAAVASSSTNLWSEAIAPPVEEAGLATWVEQLLLPLRGADEPAQEQLLRLAWSRLRGQGRFVWNKLLTGGFRVGVSQTLVVRALAEATGLPVDILAHRLAGDWSPSAEFYTRLASPAGDETRALRPYPFTLAQSLPAAANSTSLDLAPIQTALGDERAYLAEWKWDGIRAQLLRRGNDLQLWSRGDELLTERFPELHADARQLPSGVVLDGEIVAWRDGRVLPFTLLQQRITRKQLGRKLLTEVPCVFIAFDLLEHHGVDLRPTALRHRRHLLEQLLASADSLHSCATGSARAEPSTDNRALAQPTKPLPRTSPIERGSIRLAEAFREKSLAELAVLRTESRARGVEGLMLKRLDSHYASGREQGAWWKWKIDPYTVDAVLVAAQVGHGRRANLFTDYTFAVWDGDTLVPFAKAYSGLTDDELKAIDAFVRKSTVDKFGPVRSVTPELVFELAFENLQRSTRHKSGIAVRFPRILRQRTDKTIHDADTLDRILALLPPAPPPRSPSGRETEAASTRQRTFAFCDSDEGTS
jgi:DNA ligase-1